MQPNNINVLVRHRYLNLQNTKILKSKENLISFF